MQKVECAKCSKRYNASKHKSCPECGSRKLVLQEIPVAPETDFPKIIAEDLPKVEKPVKVKSPKSDKTRSARQEEVLVVERVKHSAVVAVRSAKIVSGYGTFLQVVGAIVGVGCIVSGYLLTHHYGSKEYVIGGVAIGLVDFALFAVQGAVFRMIANYVIAQLDNSK